MPQHLNLLDASFQRPRVPLGSVAGLLALTVTLGASVALTWGLQVKSAQALVDAKGFEGQLQTLHERGADPQRLPPSLLVNELTRLRAVEAGQLRVTSALDSGQAGVPRGYSDFLLALSRQTVAQLWLTSFSVGADGQALELGGRMTDPGRLPDYLRRLNAEPMFKGIDFAQLNLKTLGGGAPAPAGADAAAFAAPGNVPVVTEFVLRAAPGASGVR